MFKRKHIGRIRKERQERLLKLLMECKERWLRQKRLVENSIDPSEEVLHQLRLAEAKYMFLLKEARNTKEI
ncbi:MAG: YaaL family protein [Tuberibacillus sp.]